MVVNVSMMETLVSGASGEDSVSSSSGAPCASAAAAAAATAAAAVEANIQVPVILESTCAGSRSSWPYETTSANLVTLPPGSTSPSLIR